jgi:hypothetical protein
LSSYNVSRFIIIKEDSEAIERCPWSNLQAEAFIFLPFVGGERLSVDEQSIYFSPNGPQNSTFQPEFFFFV